MKYLVLLFIFISCAHHGNKSIYLPEGQKFMMIKSGRVHRSCLIKFGQKITTLIDESIGEGMICLRETGGYANQIYSTFKKLHDGKNITFVCNDDDKDFDWSKYTAFASTSSASNYPEQDLIHPYVTINPNLVLKDSDVKGEPISDRSFKLVLFHESFHNLGYRHGLTPDYAYACEECCDGWPPGVKEIACKICSTRYESVADEKYLKDVQQWLKKSDRDYYIMPWSIYRSALVLKPKHELAMKLLLTGEDAKNLVTKYFVQNLGERSYTKDIANYEVSASLSPLISLAKQIALLEATLYLKGNKSETKKQFGKLKLDALKLSLRSTDKKLKNESIKIWKWLYKDVDTLNYMGSKDPNDDSFYSKFDELKEMYQEKKK